MTSASRTACMPSLLHEVLVELLREMPPALEALLQLPAHDALVPVSEALGDALPRELRCDGRLLLQADGAPVMTLVLEVQLATDDDKPMKWPVYLTSARLKDRCPALLVVIAVSRQVAQWAKQPIEVGPGSVVTPLVLGPDEVPAITDLDQAMRQPEVTALSAIVHSRDADAHKAALITATLHQLVARGALKGDAAVLYNEVTYALLPVGARKELKMLSPEFVQKLKNYEWQHPAIREFISSEVAEGRARGHAEGHAEGFIEGREEGLVVGRIQTVLELLELRGLTLTAAQRAQIQALRDVAELDRLFRAAVTATSVDELLR